MTALKAESRDAVKRNKSSNRDPTSTQGKLRPASFLSLGAGGHPCRRKRETHRGFHISAVLISIALDRHDCRGAHPEWELRVAVLEYDPHREALREPHPVERRLSLRQPLDGRAVLLIERPSHALHAAPKALVGI